MNKKHEIVFKSLTIKIFLNENEALYFFNGDVDETFEYKRIPVASRARIRFDLEGITSINSCGVREWSQLIKQFSNKINLTLEKCSIAIIDQFNIVSQTLGRATVKSFYAPYYCPTCDEETNILLDAEQHRQSLANKLAPEVIHSCGNALEFDALEDCYFQQIERLWQKKTG
jgi:hypothetical protein